MSDSKLLDRQIKHVEDLAAVGVDLEGIAKDFDLTLRQFKSLMENDQRIAVAIKKGEERFEILTDQERRRRLDLADSKFRPTPTEINHIKELATIGWAELKIADAYGLNPRSWKTAKDKYPQLKEALRVGALLAGGKRIQNTIDAWMPSPRDLEMVRDLASEGNTIDVISVTMGLPVRALKNKMDDLPELREAFNSGKALLQAKLSSKAISMALGGQVNMLIFVLKAQFQKDWSDRPPTAAEISAEMKEKENGGRTKKFDAPKPVSIKDFARDAEKEAKAAKERRAKMKVVGAN